MCSSRTWAWESVHQCFRIPQISCATHVRPDTPSCRSWSWPCILLRLVPPSCRRGPPMAEAINATYCESLQCYCVSRWLGGVVHVSLHHVPLKSLPWFFPVVRELAVLLVLLLCTACTAALHCLYNVANQPKNGTSARYTPPPWGYSHVLSIVIGDHRGLFTLEGSSLVPHRSRIRISDSVCFHVMLQQSAKVIKWKTCVITN